MNQSNACAQEFYLGDKILAAVEDRKEGLSIREISEITGIAEKTVSRYTRFFFFDELTPVPCVGDDTRYYLS